MDVLTLPARPHSATPAARPVTITRGSLLALDLGTSTGWALRTPDDFTSSGTVLLKHTRYDGGGMRFLRFRRWLEDLEQDAGPIEAIYFEEVRRHAGTDAAHIYGGLLGVVTEVTVRLLVQPQAARALLLGFPSVEAAGACVADIIVSSGQGAVAIRPMPSGRGSMIRRSIP